MTLARRIREDFSLMAILIIPIAIAINFVGGSLALALKLPLYLDSIGTFLVAMLAGPFVGALTGFLSLAFVSATDPTSLPWTVQAAVVGAMVGWLARRGLLRRPLGVVATIILVILVSVTGVVLIRLLVFGGFTTNGSSVIAAVMVAAGVPMIPAQFASSFVSELPDKTLSILLALVVIRSMSDRYLIKFSNGRFFTAHARRKRRGRAAPAPVDAAATETTQLAPLQGAAQYGTYSRWRWTRSGATAARPPQEARR
ncbi:ECF transporter S component [Brachybacterium subflavum]|uniref:ECF transporter S component n=1 Tax=Brachybacterium subflavum TaxID=2585206 RepID=UPI001266532D|nr:ECF transporter S component [Brachybacterium subflavum]